MNTFDLTPLPARPNLEQYKRQAKELVKRAAGGDSASAERIRTLADAQFAIARQHGFESWPKFSKHIAALAQKVSSFDLAADAIVEGDAAAVESMLREHPELARARSTRVHRATLLHYVGANGLENYRQKTPKNIVVVARLLLDASADVNALADIYGTSATLSLVASSAHPQRAGVHIALMEALLEYGADVNGAAGSNPLLAALRNGRGEAADFLATHGAWVDLEGAAGVGRLDLAADLQASATTAQIEAGFHWACEYGRNSVIEFLLRQMDLSRSMGLHWAVVGGQLDTIRLLLHHGAPLETKNEYGATPLGQALWSATNGGTEIDYVSIVETLIEAGAKVEDDSTKAHIAELLRRHGAKS
jgi:ankyrin repeat protein